MSQINTNTIKDASGGNTATINGMTPTATSLQGFRNRIINGAMVIDQRNAGAAFTPTTTGQYFLDRWRAGNTQASKLTFQQNYGSVTPPTGFTKYLGVVTASAYSVTSTDVFLFQQTLEGYNTADLAWGTASASAVTLSFWVRSSLTGTFGGALSNASRSYPFTFVINAANTWEYKTVTVPGDTTGTWPTDNSGSISVRFCLGAGSTYATTAGAWAAGDYYSAPGATSVVGTNGATFYITGVQLEVGSVATPFEQRDYGTELLRCHRYYRKYTSGTSSTGGIIATGFQASTTYGVVGMSIPVSMRSTPTLEYASLIISDSVTFDALISGISIDGTSNTAYIGCIIAANGALFRPCNLRAQSNSSGYLSFLAEL